MAMSFGLQDTDSNYIASSNDYASGAAFPISWQGLDIDRLTIQDLGGPQHMVVVSNPSAWATGIRPSYITITYTGAGAPNFHITDITFSYS